MNALGKEKTSLHRINYMKYIIDWQRCRDGVMNEFVSWCRHLLVSFLFHALTSLHPPSFYRNDFSTSKVSDDGYKEKRECDVGCSSAIRVRYILDSKS